jgi:hypothetical protein
MVRKDYSADDFVKQWHAGYKYSRADVINGLFAPNELFGWLVANVKKSSNISSTGDTDSISNGSRGYSSNGSRGDSSMVGGGPDANEVAKEAQESVNNFLESNDTNIPNLDILASTIVEHISNENQVQNKTAMRRIATVVAGGARDVINHTTYNIWAVCRDAAVRGYTGLNGLVTYVRSCNKYTVRRGLLGLAAGAVTVGTYLSEYWSPYDLAQKSCMTVLVPFLTEMGAAPYCGVEVQSQGLIPTIRQVASTYLPNVENFMTAFSLTADAQTARYDIAARGIFVITTALITLSYGTWTQFIASGLNMAKRNIKQVLSSVKQYYGGKVTDKDALGKLLLDEFKQLGEMWENMSFDTALYIAKQLMPNSYDTTEDLMNGTSIFGHELDNIGFNFSTDINEDVRPQAPTSYNVEEASMIETIADDIAKMRLEPELHDQSDNITYKMFMSRLQVISVTAAMYTSAKSDVDVKISDEALKAFKDTMQLYRDYNINTLFAAEDLVIAVGGASALASESIQQGGIRMRRKKTKSKASQRKKSKSKASQRKKSRKPRGTKNKASRRVRSKTNRRR